MENTKHLNCDKMIIAILQNDNYHKVISDLNRHGYGVTVLHSSGGFLKKSNATIMIGVNHEHLDDALELLKKYGERTEVEYKMATTTAGMSVPAFAVAPVAIPVHVGGIVIFVLDVERNERY